MMLKVGELARRTGVTVRALHHYDSIGLLRPSGRSEGGYRLYDRDDVARLHGIQTLRQLGLPLDEVARVLDGSPASLQSAIARQITLLDEQIRQSQGLRGRLAELQSVLAAGRWPDMDDWLSSLSTMSTYRQHFTADELERALQRWKPHEAEWPPLVQAIRAAMARGVRCDAVEIQPLVAQWLALVSRWMEGDLEFLGRWGRMLREHPELPLPAGMDLALLDYLDEAIGHRLSVVARLVTPEQQRRLADLRPDWHAFVERGRRLMADQVPPEAPAARELARDWQALWQRTVGEDTALRDRLIAAYESEPLLHAGLPITAALRHYIEQASGP